MNTQQKITKDQKDKISLLEYYFRSDWKKVHAILYSFGYPPPENKEQAKEYAYDLFFDSENGEKATMQLVKSDSLLRRLIQSELITNKGSIDGKGYLNYSGENVPDGYVVPQIPTFHGKQVSYVNPTLPYSDSNGLYSPQNMVLRSNPTTPYDRYMSAIGTGFNSYDGGYTTGKNETIRSLKQIGIVFLLILGVEALFNK